MRRKPPDISAPAANFSRLRRHLTINFHLTCLVVACVFPVWLVTGFLVQHAYVSKRALITGHMLETARALSMAVDRELASVQAALQALATSPTFTSGDFGGIHRQTLELLRSYPGADIIVADSTAQQLVNSYRPFGEKLPRRKTPETVRRIFESGKPIVSDLFFGALTRRPLIAVDVPVLRNGRVVYDLSMTFPSDRVAAILLQQRLPKEWFGTILDSKSMMVARSSDPGRFVGRQASPALRQAMAGAEEGMVKVSNLEGIPVFETFNRSSMSGWAVVIGVPTAVVLAEMYQWLWWVLGGAVILSFIGVVLSMVIGRRIVQSIQSLVPPALAIGRGEPVTVIDRYSVTEVEEVAGALVQASKLLQGRLEERDKAEGALLEETTKRLKAVESLREKEQMLIQQSRQAAMGEMIGNIAHQWRQPLNNLGLTVQQLLLVYDLGEFNRAFLENGVGRSMDIIQHMSRTIDDFRNYFRPEKEKVDFKVHEAIARTLSLIEDSFNNQRIRVEIVAHDEPDIYGYPNEYAQVLLNILINARDALTEKEVGDPRIMVTIGTHEQRAVVTIADNAGGIPEAIIDRIFDPYFTTKESQLGTGVGLFMSKTIIEKNMGGRLTARNVDGGAEFRIEV